MNQDSYIAPPDSSSPPISSSAKSASKGSEDVPACSPEGGNGLNEEGEAPGARPPGGGANDSESGRLDSIGIIGRSGRLAAGRRVAGRERAAAVRVVFFTERRAADAAERLAVFRLAPPRAVARPLLRAAPFFVPPRFGADFVFPLPDRLARCLAMNRVLSLRHEYLTATANSRELVR